MVARRSLELFAGALALAAVAAAGATAPGQQAPAADPARLLPPHHAPEPPDYRAAMRALDSLRVALPPAPLEGPYSPRLHRTARLPDYLDPVRAPGGRSIAIPPPPPGQPPAVVRGLYINAWVFGSTRFFDLVRLADTTEVNALVIDVKDATGQVSYRSSVPTAVEIGASRWVRVPDARERLRVLRERGIHAIARIVVARDPLLARMKPHWAIADKEGGLWRDGLGDAWVDAYHDSVWVYAADLAAEAVVMGFDEIQFDYIRWPDEPRHRMARAVFQARRPGDTQRAALKRHLTLLADRVGALGVPFTVDVFGLTTSTPDGMGIGQHWDDIAQVADVVLPMVYPSHYPRGSYGIRHPNAEPYATVRRALEDGIRRNERLPKAARIRPYLQAFSIFGVRYSTAEVRAQIQAVEDLGLTDWILWNARGVYPAQALRPAGPPRPAVAAGSAEPGTER